MCIKQVEEASKVLNYLVDRSRLPSPWHIVRLIPFIELKEGAESKSFIDDHGQVSIRDEQMLEKLFQQTSPQTFAIAWLNYHFCSLQMNVMGG